MLKPLQQWPTLRKRGCTMTSSRMLHSLCSQRVLMKIHWMHGPTILMLKKKTANKSRAHFLLQKTLWMNENMMWVWLQSLNQAEMSLQTMESSYTGSCAWFYFTVVFVSPLDAIWKRSPRQSSWPHFQDGVWAPASMFPLSSTSYQCRISSLNTVSPIASTKGSG